MLCMGYGENKYGADIFLTILYNVDYSDLLTYSIII